MRLLFTTTGHAGHVLPLVPLARACLRQPEIGQHQAVDLLSQRFDIDLRRL